MSGHNKWSKIKHQKQANDLKKGKIFSKLAQQITAAVREGGGDESMNASLRTILDQAKAEDMPADNIKRAINRGLGKSESGEDIIFEAAAYEGYGPAEVSIIVDVLTDNKNRVVSDLRTIFNTHGGNLGESGSVSWNFKQKGRVIVRCGRIIPAQKFGEDDKVEDLDCEEVMMKLMDIEGIEDLKPKKLEDGDGVEIITSVGNMGKVKDEVETLSYIVRSSGLVKIPNLYKEISDTEEVKLKKLIDELDAYEDVQNIWTDVKLDQ